MNDTVPQDRKAEKYPVRGHRVIPFLCFATVVLLAVLLSGCGKRMVSLPPHDRSFPPEIETDRTPYPPGHKPGPADALYADARKLMAQGAFSQAELSLERAIRIDSGNGYYWYTMGKIKYRQGEHSQAVQFCLKSKSLAGRDTTLIRLNDQLIETIRRDQQL